MDQELILQEANYVDNLGCYKNAIETPRGL